MKKFEKYFIILVILAFVLGLFAMNAQAEEVVCINSKDVIDVISLLDASERDLELLSSCEKLVKDLYKEIENKDSKINTLTKELITARQETIEYKSKNATLKRITWYSVTGSVLLTIVTILPVVL